MAIGHYPLDPTTDVGLVRVLTGDTDPTNPTGTAPNQTATYLWLTDAEITALVTANGASAPRAAIYILRLISLTPAMKLKKWTSAELAIDGAAITNALTLAINAIEKGLADATALEASDYFAVVNTGAAMAQPSLYSLYGPAWPAPFDEIDRTLPWGLDL